MAELATVARPYAKALFGLAQEQNKLKPWLDKLNLLSLVSQQEKVISIFKKPELKGEEKAKQFLDLLDSEELDQELINVIKVLSENGRLTILNAVYEQYRGLFLENEHIQDAILYIPYSLNKEEVDSIVEKVENKFKTKLETKLVIDPELIGGFKIEFGDQVLDMSVKSDLNLLLKTVLK